MKEERKENKTTSKVKYHFYSDGTVGSKIWEDEEEQIHREDGPAFEYSSGRRIWYKNGFLHREDGPAIIYEDRTHLYFLNGNPYTKEEYWKKLRKGRKRERKEGKREINDCES